MTASPMPSVSLLHATFHAVDPVRETWLAVPARRQDRVEHIFALDANDDESVAATEGYRRVIGPSGISSSPLCATGTPLLPQQPETCSSSSPTISSPSDWDVALRWCWAVWTPYRWRLPSR